MVTSKIISVGNLPGECVGGNRVREFVAVWGNDTMKGSGIQDM